MNIMSTPIISEIILSYWSGSRKTKLTPSGWVSGNAPCCVHNGTGADKRKRGGFINGSDGSVSYSCFNCGYKTSWSPGRTIPFKMKKLLEWMGVSDQQVRELSFEALKQIDQESDKSIKKHLINFKEVKFDNSVKLLEKDSCNNSDSDHILDYLSKRSLNLNDYDFYYSTDPALKNRIIVPFRYNNCLVGWTSRTLDNNGVRYISNQQPGYVFNLDNQGYNRKYTIICEGVFDAILVKGVALLGSSLKENQAELIKRLPTKKILVPDRDKKGKQLIEPAIDQGWSVSMPDWKQGIKDINDAVHEYGRIYTVYSIISCAESSSLKIQLKAKKWFNI